MIKNIIILFSFIVLVISGCNQIDQQEKSNTASLSEIELTEELRQVVFNIWEDARNSNIDQLKSAHLNSSKFSKFGPRIAERQNVDQTNISETEHFLSIRDAILEIEDLKIDLFDNVGIVTFYNIYSFTKDENEISGKGRVTLVFLRTDNGWKIVHEHSSSYGL